MSTTATSFYVTGGTLRADAPSYVERQADRDLHESLSRGEFCYVLHARQMGKSSLMVRAAARLREEGVAVVVLDLTTIGQNLSPEQWYDGLLVLVGQQLDLEDELEESWQERSRLGPLQRWLAALREVVLAQIPGRIVIFVDEIDTVRSLPFSTDEFFAGIRECYNRRTQGPEFERLTFCLLGVATPSDLIRDTRLTPFNIGRRIELTDFTPAEAAPLAGGLGRKEPVGRALLARVLYWTGGHPYLTQRLCQAAAQDHSVIAAAGVDRLCEELFLSLGAREQDDNLLFVRERLLRSESDLAALLDLYGQVCRGKRVAADETNLLVSHLRLSGITRPVGSVLRVRNRIYSRVFDREWITAHMPDAEVRRQRAAYRRGLLRTAAVAGGIIAVIGAMALSSFRLAGERQRALVAARSERDRANQFLSTAQLNVAQQSWEEGNLGRARQVLETLRPKPGEEDPRSFEWRYLWRLCQGDALFTLRGHEGFVYSVAYSPDGKTLATGGLDHTARLWEVASQREVATFKGHKDRVDSVAYSPDGKILATRGFDDRVKLWDVASRREVATLQAPTATDSPVVFSPDGRIVATGGTDGRAWIWEVASRREVATLNGQPGVVSSLAFSPDGKILATGSLQSVKLWDTATWQTVAALAGHPGGVNSLAFSPDGQTLAAGSGLWNGPLVPGEVKLWDVASRRELGTLKGYTDEVLSLAFSPNGKILATASEDATVKLWDVVSQRAAGTLKGHAGGLNCVAFSPDGKTLATSGNDGTVKVWNPTREPANDVFVRHRGGVFSVAFSPDGRTMASGGVDQTAKLWDVAGKREVTTLKGHSNWVIAVAFSPNGRTLATGSEDGTIKLWDIATRREVATFQGPEPSQISLSIAFSPDGKRLATGGRDVRLWDCVTRQEVATFKGDPGWGHFAIFSPDGTMLAIGGDEKTVTLWDAVTGRKRFTLQGHRDLVRCAAFSPDGKTLAAGSYDGTVRAWDIASQREVAVLDAHPRLVYAMAFSPDGKNLATVGHDRRVKLWSTTTWRLTLSLRGHTDAVRSVAFSPDGNTLATGGFDGTVLWHASPFAETDGPAGTPQSSR